MERVAANRRSMASAFLVSALYQILTVGITYIVVIAFGLNVRAATVFTLMPLVWFTTLVPVSPGGLGLREVGFIFLFGQLAVSEERASLCRWELTRPSCGQVW